MVNRVATGIKGFDEIIEGGIPTNCITLITGPPGSGKSLFSMEYLINGCKMGENCLFISFEQSEKDIISQTSRFDWQVGALVQQGKLTIHSFDIMTNIDILEKIENTVKEKGITRVVIDSLTALQSYPLVVKSIKQMDIMKNYMEQQYEHASEREMLRLLIHLIVRRLKKLENTTVILVTDIYEGSEQLSSDGISEFLCDGIIVLHYLSIGSEENKNLEVRKMRWTKHKSDIYPFKITEDGIELAQEGSSTLLR